MISIPVYNGRLSRELKELSELINRINSDTLVLFNEPFTSCTSVDSLTMSLELICYLKLLGVRGLWVTHIHVLADQCDILNKLLEQGSKLISLVVGVEEGDDKLLYPNYKVCRVKPQHSSFALDALRRNGIDWL
jgi:DNA mismatch repair ATPase MutS